MAGTHGKTTTASMLVHALRAAGLEPGWLVGAPVGGWLPNAQWGEGEWLVVEADESDRSMLSLRFEIAVLTNVELDHHATFGSLVELEAAFRGVPGAGHDWRVVWDRPELLELREVRPGRGRGRGLVHKGRIRLGSGCLGFDGGILARAERHSRASEYRGRPL